MSTRIGSAACTAVPGAALGPWPELGIAPRAPSPPPLGALSAAPSPPIGSLPAPVWDAATADRTLLAYRARLAPLSAELAEAAQAAVAVQAWTRYGFARPSDFVRERWGRSGRWFSDLAALGAAMSRSAALRGAVAGSDGARPVGRVAALMLARRIFAGPESADADDWIAFARTITVRELRKCFQKERGRDGPRCEPEDLEEADAVALEVRLGVPTSVAALFEDTLDLHRAVCGHSASTESFVEALAAEAAAGPRPPDASCEPVSRSAPRVLVEEAFDRLRAERLGADVFHSGAQTTAAGSADPRVDQAPEGSTSGVLSNPAPGADVFRAQSDAEQRARTAVEHLQALVDAEEAIERRVGQLLDDMNRHDAWATLGFASLGHYAVERLGMARRTAESRAGILRALHALPAVLAAYEAGVIGLEAAWLVRRILGASSSPVDPSIQDRWVQHAQTVTIKRLRHELRRVHLHAIESSFDDRAPLPATDEEWYASLRREPGMTRARLRDLEITALDPDASRCNADSSADVFLQFRAAPDIATSFLAAVESARRHAATAAVHNPRLASAPASLRAAALFLDRGQRPPGWVGLLALLEDYAETHDDPRAFPKRQWDAIYSRDGWQCTAAACTGRRRMDDHHIVYRADCGGDEPANQITLCRFHHQQGEHGRYAEVRGVAPLGVVWRLGSPALATHYQNERRIGVRAGAGLGRGRVYCD